MSLTPSIYSTSSLALDTMLGGGFTGGSIVEVFGEEDVGKTSIALGTMSRISDYHESTLYIDLERTLSSPHAHHFGLNPNSVNVAHPTTSEEALMLLEAAVKGRKFKLIVIDSIPALISSFDLNNPISSEATKGTGLAKLLRSLLVDLLASNCVLILVNQLRNYPSFTDPNVYFETSPGGVLLKSLCATRIKLERINQFLDPVQLLSIVDSKVTVASHLFCEPPCNPISFRIVYSKGFDNNLSLTQLSDRLKIPASFEAVNLHLKNTLNYTNYNL